MVGIAEADPEGAGVVVSKAGLRRELVGFVVAAVAVAVLYTLYTRHVWEDYFITFRHSRNLVRGHGLVYHPGERVHGFTSPLGTLLPALCDWLAGAESYEPSLWLYRALSIAAFAAGGALVLRAFQEEDGGANRAARRAFAVLYLFEIKLVDFTINGMETGLLLLLLGWAFLLHRRGIGPRWISLGACWAALMWTRPDGFIPILALALADGIFAREPRRDLVAAGLKAAAVGAVLYLPWFVGAWAYYGSPVPHTIVAKANVEGGVAGQVGAVAPDLLDRFFRAAALAFRPIYAHLMELPNWRAYWHPGIAVLTMAMGAFAALYAIVPTGDRLGRMASVAFGVLCLYLATLVSIFPWYLAPPSLFGSIALARGLPALAGAFRGHDPRRRAVALALLAVIGAERVVLFGLQARQLRIQQAEIEEGLRTRIGLWLKQNGRPGDRVYLEPIGYIGFFSGLRITDWPGLVAPEVVRRRRAGANFETMVRELRPEWVVLRLREAPPFLATDFFERDYELARVFDARPRLARYGWIPGRYYLDFDSVFLVYRRKGA